jgi:TRAP-type C4-dicarboxylate transport system permease small subunit
MRPDTEMSRYPGGRYHLLGKLARLPTRRFYWLSGGALLAIMGLISVGVILRYFFNRPIGGVYELIQILMVFAVFFSLAYTQVYNGHIAVAFIFDRLPKKLRLLLDTSISLIGLALFALMGYMSLLQGLKICRSNQTTMVLKIPEGPFYFVVSVGCLLFCLVLIARITETLLNKRT